jgi:hypothetical protein
VGKTEGKGPLRLPMQRCEDNIKSDHVAGWRGMDFIDLAQYGDRWQALVNAVRKLRVPSNVGNLLVS